MNVTSSKAAACRGKSESRPPGTSVALRKPSSPAVQPWVPPVVPENGQGPIETGLQLRVLPLHLPDQVAADHFTRGVSLDE